MNERAFAPEPLGFSGQTGGEGFLQEAAVPQGAPRSCVRCGACMAVCPLYRLTGREPAVARGKLTLWELFREGRLNASGALRDLMEYCLLCGACTEKCAVGLEVPELVKRARAALKEEGFREFRPSWVLARAAWQAPRLIPAAAPFALLINRLKDWLGQESGLAYRLWPHLSLALAHFPNLHRIPFRRQVPVQLPGRGSLRVAFFSGCGVEALFPEAGLAFLAICEKLGIEVVIPPDQGCCGLLAESVGEVELARALGKRFLTAFAGLKVDFVVTACASCSYQLKRLGELGVGEPQLETAQGLAEKVREAGEFFWAEAGFRPQGRFPSRRVAYHDPCHLLRGQGIAAAPRELLIRATGEAPLDEGRGECCGLGGTFGITAPQVSRELGQARLARLQAAGAEVVATSCSGCLIQFNRVSSHLPVVHLLQLLC